MGWALALKDQKWSRIPVLADSIVKWLKVLSGALNVQVKFLFSKCQLHPVHYTRVCFLVTFTQLQRARSALQGAPESRADTSRGGGDDWFSPAHPQVHRLWEQGRVPALPWCTWMGTQLPAEAQVLFSSSKSALRLLLPPGNTFVQMSSTCKTLAVGERVFNDAFKNSLC